MKVTATSIPDVLIIEPTVFGDERGFFMESWNKKAFDEAVGRPVEFVQDNHSRSGKGVLRGLHYQIKQPQGKLVRVIEGTVYDVAVDLRNKSNTFGEYVVIELSAENKRQLWIPEGFAHGFYVVTESAEFVYKTTDYYLPEAERSLLWNDSELAIMWPLATDTDPIISSKDALAPKFNRSAKYF